MWYESNLLIDGELVPATGGRTYESINPATGDVIASAADATVEDAERAVAAARRAFDETDWSRDRDFRVHCLRQLVDALRKNVEDLRALTIADVGVPVGLTSGPALEGTFEIPEYYAGLLESYEFSHEIGTVDGMAGTSHLWWEREPVGVVSAITGYNYPHQLNLAKMGPALAAGCTVVVKGAPQTPLVTLALGRIIAEHTDIPAGVVNVLTSSETAPAEVLTTHRDVDMITFTGSTATGRRIMAAAAPTMKKCFFELGGKSALIVLDEESIPLGAMVGAFATCSHSGQGCAITSRLVVPREHYEAAIEQVAGMMAGITVGDPSDPAHYMGPLITQQQLDKVQGMVDRARDAGARVVCGGGRPEGLDKGFFFQPTLIADAAEDSEIAQDEVFGPVLVIQAHDGDDDAVRVANNSYYGLSGMVAAQDHARAKAVASRIRSGTMSVNGGGWHHPSAPFGGVKQSGFGRENGVPGLEEFLNIKTYAEPADKAG